MSLALLLLPQLVSFREAGYEVIGLSAPGPFVPQLEDAGIRHVPLGSPTRARDLIADAAAAMETYQTVRELSPVILHTHNPKPGVYGRIGGRLAQTPIVVNTVHGLYAQPGDPWQRRLAVYTLERLAATCSDAELVQNPEDLLTLRRLGVAKHKLHLLGNGIDLSRFDPGRYDEDHRRRIRAKLGIADNDVLVGLVGRLVAEKGYRDLFAAAQRLRREAPSVRFAILGPHDADKADALSRTEIEAAEAAGVTFLGFRADVETIYAAFDIYVLASHREGFPRSAMEAAAMGLPTVATDIRGCRQVVEHDRTGLLIPVRDVHSLTAAIGRLVREPDTRRAFGAAARRKAAAEFDERQQIATTLDVYDRLCRGHREGRR